MNLILSRVGALPLIGSFSNDDGDGSKNVKKQYVWLAKQQLCTCSTLFCTFICRHCATTTWKCLISRFMEDINKRKLFLFHNLSVVPKKSAPGKFDYIWHFQGTGISVIQFEKTRIHLKSDFFAAVAVVDAEAPYWPIWGRLHLKGGTFFRLQVYETVGVPCRLWAVSLIS